MNKVELIYEGNGDKYKYIHKLENFMLFYINKYHKLQERVGECIPMEVKMER